MQYNNIILHILYYTGVYSADKQGVYNSCAAENSVHICGQQNAGRVFTIHTKRTYLWMNRNHLRGTCVWSLLISSTLDFDSILLWPAVNRANDVASLNSCYDKSMHSSIASLQTTHTHPRLVDTFASSYIHKKLF